jgi:hypothetical protein
VLAEHFWREAADDDRGELPDELLAELLRRDWPGTCAAASAVERAAPRRSVSTAPSLMTLARRPRSSTASRSAAKGT